MERPPSLGWVQNCSCSGETIIKTNKPESCQPMKLIQRSSPTTAHVQVGATCCYGRPLETFQYYAKCSFFCYLYSLTVLTYPNNFNFILWSKRTIWNILGHVTIPANPTRDFIPLTSLVRPVSETENFWSLYFHVRGQIPVLQIRFNYLIDPVGFPTQNLDLVWMLLYALLVHNVRVWCFLLWIVYGCQAIFSTNEMTEQSTNH